MNKSAGFRAACALSGTALAVSAGALPALAAAKDHAPAATGWRVLRKVSIRGRSVLLASIDAVSAGDAWVAGESGIASVSRQKPLIEHWNGRAWLAVRLPRNDTGLFTRQGLFGFIGASSSRNVWAFSENGSYLRLSGRHWTEGRIPLTGAGRVAILSAHVFSRTDVWAFGTRFIGAVSKLDFRPYAANFNGTKWTAVPISGRGGVSVSAVSPRDMWALTGATSAGSGLPFKAQLLHWDGKAWRRQPVQPPLPAHASLASVLALSDADVWVGGGVPNSRTGTSELAMRWNGKAWAVASPLAPPSGSDYFLGEVAPDGTGGFWSVSERFPGSFRIWHRSNGTWSAPTTARWDFFQLAAVPDTQSTWAIAANAAATSDLIILHGPVPH